MSLTQAPGQTLPDFGGKLADAVLPLIRSFLPAKDCIDQVSTNPKKAADEAKKVLKDTPGFALAEYCLAQIAQATDSNSAEALADYQAAAKGDSLSILPWTQIADIHRRMKDSNSVVADFQHMLRIDPTNQKLAETARKYFILYNRRDAAKQVVEEQLKNDPNNPDWLDLESNYCIADSDFKCVVDALSKVYVMDSTRADTTFYAKILYAASQPPENPDTTAYMEWAQRGAAKYPENGDILEALARAYAMTGQDDSAVAVSNRMMQADPTKTTALLFVVQGLVKARQVHTPRCRSSRWSCGSVTTRPRTTMAVCCSAHCRRNTGRRAARTARRPRTGAR